MEINGFVVVNVRIALCVLSLFPFPPKISVKIRLMCLVGEARTKSSYGLTLKGLLNSVSPSPHRHGCLVLVGRFFTVQELAKQGLKSSPLTKSSLSLAGCCS